MSQTTLLNVYGKPLQVCGIKKMTGWKRNGYCETDENDIGTHIVCAKITNKFLQFTKSRGNDLITPRPNFPGLEEGDFWCICITRWLEAYNYDPKIAPKINLEATYLRAHQWISFDILEKYKL